MKPNFSFRVFTLILALGLLSACGSSVDWDALSSEDGHVPEAYLPEDLAAVVSFSLLNEEQAQNIRDLETRMKKEESIQETLGQSLDAETQALIQALGEKYRFVFGVQQGEAQEKNQFFVATLADVDAMKKSLEAMKADQTLSEYKVQGNLAYANKDKTAYFMVEKDLLLMATRPDDLVGMLDQKNALQKNESYVEALKEHEATEDVFFAQLRPNSLDAVSTKALTGISSLVASQTVSIHAEGDGLAMTYTMQADPEKMKKAKLESLYEAREKAYLAKDLPAKNLMALYEAYDIAGSFEMLKTLGGSSPLDAWSDSTQRFLGLNMDEIMLLLDKGALVAAYQNGEAVVPGLTLLVDVESDPEKAKTLMTTIQTQLSSLAALLETSLPGALVLELAKDEKEWNRLRLDLSQLPQNQANAVGALLSQEPLELLFGLRDNRLMLSFASVMGEENAEPLKEDARYQALLKKMQGEEGQIYMDVQALSQYLASVRLLREALGLEETASLAQMESFLQGFDAFMASGESFAKGSRMDGFLQIKGNE